MISNCEDEIPISTQEYFFYEAVKDHKDIAVEIAHYQRIEDDLNPDGSGTKHPDRSFGHLWLALRRKQRKDGP